MQQTIRWLQVCVLALIAGVMGVTAIGCKTVDGQAQAVVTPERVEKVTKLAAYASARALLVQEPGMRGDLAKARQGFEDLANANQWDIATAAAIAVANGLPFLSSDEGQVLLTGTYLFIDLIGGGKVDLARIDYARAVVLGARDGLTLALGVAKDAQTLDAVRSEAIKTR